MAGRNKIGLMSVKFRATVYRRLDECDTGCPLPQGANTGTTLLVVSPDAGEAKCLVGHEFSNSIVEGDDDGEDENDGQRGQLNWHVLDHAESLSDGVGSVIVLRRPHKAGGWLHVHLSLRRLLSDGADSREDILSVGGGAERVEGAARSHNGRGRGKCRPGPGVYGQRPA